MNDKNERFLESVLKRLVHAGVALAAEKDSGKILEIIINEAMAIYNADGGTLYLTTEDKQGLQFSILKNKSLNSSMGGVSGTEIPFPPLPLFKDNIANQNNVATATYHANSIISVDDAYEDSRFDFSGTKKFDESMNYHSKSFLCVPLRNLDNEISGILQLINATDENNNKIPFNEAGKEIILALASQAAVALDKQRLIDQQEELWNALIKLIASAIDDKSPYTGGHCQRVPVLTQELVKKAEEADYGVFKEFSLTRDGWRELYIACWLHDCGKITTPEYVIDKGSKLETLYNRVHEIRMRFEVLRRDAEIECLKAQLNGTSKEEAEDTFKKECDRLEQEWIFVGRSNVGGEFMDDEDIDRINNIAKQTWTRYFDKLVGLSPMEELHISKFLIPRPPVKEKLLENKPEHHITAYSAHYNLGELYNLSVQRGTLTQEERNTINAHISVTIKMLEDLPLPQQLRRVPEFAGGHHERIDGKGYPKGLTGAQMSIPARAMAIADIFEALTAADRPYKKAKTLTQSLNILKNMAENGHVDPNLYQLFISKDIWKDYADNFLERFQVDDVNKNDYLLDESLVKDNS